MPELLRTEDIMDRYGCERHTATAIMRKLPVLKVGKRLFVRKADLQDWEETRMEYPMAKTRHTTQTITKIARRRAQ